MEKYSNPILTTAVENYSSDLDYSVRANILKTLKAD